MTTPAHVQDIFLQPGEFYFGDRSTRIRTLLGSCVAITLWHPRLHIGGMCHFMLPARTIRRPDTLDGRYADEAMLLFEKKIRAARTMPGDYQVKLFGGGNMFRKPTNQADCSDVPCRNIVAARHLLQHHGYKIVAEHVGMHGHRNLIFKLWSGDVWMRHVKPVAELEDIKYVQD